jgi:hypothetical protein
MVCGGAGWSAEPTTTQGIRGFLLSQQDKNLLLSYAKEAKSFYVRLLSATRCGDIRHMPVGL